MTFSLCPPGWGSKAGYYLSATCVLLGSVTLCLIDVHKKNMRRRRRLRKLLDCDRTMHGLQSMNLMITHYVHSIKIWKEEL